MAKTFEIQTEKGYNGNFKEVFKVYNCFIKQFQILSTAVV